MIEKSCSHVNVRFKSGDIKLSASLKKQILDALSERDETAAICKDKKGNPETDSQLRDTENVPLNEDIVDYFQREVTPHVRDAWISDSKKDRDHKDGNIGKVGYEINFNRYFYVYEPPRPLEEIDVEIKQLEAEIATLLE